MKYIFAVLAVLGLFFLTAAQGQTHSTLAAGNNFFAEIEEGSGLWAWGANMNFNLGLGDDVNRPTPAPVPLLPALSGNPVSVCAGSGFMCVLDDQKYVACAGSASLYGFTSVLGIATGVSSVAHLACGHTSVHATTTEGALLSWGINHYGGLGLGHTTTPIFSAGVGCFH
jgi:alpha-tubulin suppressor-like RCC1 family protein